MKGVFYGVRAEMLYGGQLEQEFREICEEVSAEKI
jgi:hypothetical protein